MKGVRAKRAEREKAAGATRLQEENQKSLEIAAQQSANVSTPDMNAMTNGTAMNPQDARSEDAPMVENPPPASGAILSQNEDASKVQSRTAAVLDEHAMDTREDHQRLAGNVESQGENEQRSQPEPFAEEKIVPQEVSIGTSNAGGPLETPTTANLRDAQFESMFNDTELTGGTDSMDFLDFSAEGDMSQDLMNDNPFDAMAAGTDGFSNLNTASNEDINTLLPGLDSYVNASDNFMMDIPTAGANISTNQANEVPKNVAGSVGTAPIESSFEDMFDFGTAELEMGGADGEMGGDDNASIGDFGEFENWFK